MASEVTGQSMLFLFLILLLAMWAGKCVYKTLGAGLVQFVMAQLTGDQFDLFPADPFISAPPRPGRRNWREAETYLQSLSSVTVFGSISLRKRDVTPELLRFLAQIRRNSTSDYR